MYIYLFMINFLFQTEPAEIVNISSPGDLKKFVTFYNSDYKIDFIFRNKPFDSKMFSVLKSFTKLENINSIEFNSISYRTASLNEFLKIMENKNLESISFINVKMDRKTKFNFLSKTLKRFYMSSCDKGIQILHALDLNTFPALIELSIPNSNIKESSWENIMSKWVEMDQFYQLKKLDLSNNPINIDILNSIDMTKSSKLETLILNGILIDFRSLYIPGKTGDRKLDFLNGNQATKHKSIDWNKPFFKKLKHLEVVFGFQDKVMIYDKSVSKKTIELYMDTTLNKLSYFKGPQPVSGHDRHIMGDVLSLPFNSKVVPIQISEVEMITGLLRSPSLNSFEEITFHGNEMNIHLVEMVISQMPKIKQIHLNNILGYEYEIKDLILKYPNQNFMISTSMFGKPQVFPRFSKKPIKTPFGN